jgi:hypothetical protein
MVSILGQVPVASLCLGLLFSFLLSDEILINFEYLIFYHAPALDVVLIKPQHWQQ